MFDEVSPSMKAQAALLGIPERIEINDGLRYSDCDAHAAQLVAIEGTKARYQGECHVGHNYRQDFEIEELQQQAHIEDGEIVIGEDKGFAAQDLEEL